MKSWDQLSSKTSMLTCFRYPSSLILRLLKLFEVAKAHACGFKERRPVEKQLLNFRNASVSHCFRNSSLTIIWNNLGLSYYKGMKRNLKFRKKTYFKKHLLLTVQQNILPRTMEWLRDATNALEQEDSLLNKELNSSFSNYNRCFKSQDSFHTFAIRQTQIIPNESL